MRHRASWMGAAAVLIGLALPVPVTPAAPPRVPATHAYGVAPAYWAHPRRLAFVRRRPSRRAVRIARLHDHTEDGFAEVYRVLRRVHGSDGHTWLRIRVPGRPNGQTGWVRASALGPLYGVRTRLVVDRGLLRATLYRAGRRIWRSPIGVGKPSTPTPAGHFWIREKFRVADAGGPYGGQAFGTSDYSVLSDWPGGGVIGIHGTNAPGLIPGRPSHGCIRVPNDALRRLYRLMPIGTPVHVL